MTNTIIKLFPYGYKYYIEPFGGAFNVGLAEWRHGVVEIYNDLEENIYNLYKVIQDKDLFPKLKEKLDLAPYSEQLREDSEKALATNRTIPVGQSIPLFLLG